jgi:hypothetical protein
MCAWVGGEARLWELSSTLGTGLGQSCLAGWRSLGRAQARPYIGFRGEFLSSVKSFTLAYEFCYGVSVAERALVASFQRLLCRSQGRRP